MNAEKKTVSGVVVHSNRLGARALRAARLGGAFRHAWLIAAFASACSQQCTEDDEGEACGGGACDEHEHCDRNRAPEVCVCDAPYAGSECSQCATGYHTAAGSECEPDRVSCITDDCGPFAECLGTQCICGAGYTGNTCSSCADGYQDNDGDSICLPACGSSGVSCSQNETCQDESGIALCQCPDPSGVGCLACAPGYLRRPLDVACVPTCSAPDFACPSNSQCSDTDSGAECLCEPGYGGQACTHCDVGYSRNSLGDCSRPVPDDTLLLTVARTQLRSYLGALVRPDLSFTALVPIDGAVTDIAYAKEAQLLFALHQGELMTVNLSTGELAAAFQSEVELGSSLAVTPTASQIYAGSEAGILGVDLETSEIVVLTDTPVSSLALDPAGENLWAFTSAGNRLLVPLSGARPEEFGPIANAPPLSAPGQAVGSESGWTYLVGGRPETATEHLARFCRATANTLGFAAGGSVLVGGFAPDSAPRVDQVLSYDQTDPPLVLYGSAGTASETHTITVATAHQDAVVCIAVEREPLDVIVDRNAEFRLLVLVSETPALTLTVEEGFSGSVGSIHLRGATFAGPETAVSTYSNAQWQQRGLLTVDTFPARVFPTVGLVDWSTSVGSFRDLEMPEPSSALTAWGD